MRRAIFLPLLFLISSVNAQAQSIPAAVQQKIQSRIDASHADVAIAFRTLDGKSEFFYHANDPFHAASTMKIPVMIELSTRCTKASCSSPTK